MFAAMIVRFSLLVGLSLLLTACGGDESLSADAPAAATGRPTTTRISLSAAEAKSIGRKIWVNECGGTVAGLTSWNKGEYFASLGIGHFIWYHAGRRGPFEESFPPLIRFMQAQGVSGIPAWITPNTKCPWTSREAFLAAKDSPKMRELRGFLHRTIPTQTAFILQRLERALPKMLNEVPASERALVKGRFYAVASTAGGKYALMDYVNFKGEGTNPNERYKGQGWGMLQVLQDMRGKPQGVAAVKEFSASAERVLTRRVANAPKKESQWLAGWKNRARSYANWKP